MTTPFRVNQESPLQDEIRELVEQLNAYLLTLSPPEAVFHMTVEEMSHIDTTLFVARNDDGRAIGIGALKRHGQIGEVKRMYTLPDWRGKGIGRSILNAILHQARAEGLKRMVLETGTRHPEAWRLYERGGFTRCGPVLDYPDTGHSIFYELAL